MEQFLFAGKLVLGIKHVFLGALSPFWDTPFQADKLLALSVELFGVFRVKMLSHILFDQKALVGVKKPTGF